MWGVWIPVVVYAAIIFTLSSMPALGPPIKASNIDKVAHFLEYGVLGLLLARAFLRALPGRSAWLHVMLVLIVGGITGAVDEVFQGTRGREQSLGDWAADMTGLLVVSMVFIRMRGRTDPSIARGVDEKQRSVNP